MTDRMTEFPGADAPLSAWLRPVSGRLNRPREFPECSTIPGLPDGDGYASGAMLRRMRRTARKAAE